MKRDALWVLDVIGTALVLLLLKLGDWVGQGEG